jgi:hypothetical protein
MVVVVRIGRADRSDQHRHGENSKQCTLHDVPPVAASIAALVQSVHLIETLSTAPRARL